MYEHMTSLESLAERAKAINYILTRLVELYFTSQFSGHVLLYKCVHARTKGVYSNFWTRSIKFVEST